MKLFPQNGKAYVAVSALTREAGLAVKSLPGQDRLVACKDDRCAMVADFHVRNGETYVAIHSLAEALGARVIDDEAGDSTRLEFSAVPVHAQEGTVQVGQLAPDFRLTRLDGSSITLSELRGRRVLINSWASW